jgi:hypothetical protein
MEMETMDIAYTVALRDFPEELPERRRNEAESRYARELERVFRSPQEVVNALRAIGNLEDAPPDEVSEADLDLLRRWGKASNAARQAGFRDLGEADGAYFDVRVVH